MENVYIEIIQPLLQSVLRYCIYLFVFVLAALLIYAVKRYLVPFLREKLGDTRFEALTKYVRLLMCAAEEKFTETAAGLSKSDYVISLVKKKFPGIDDSYIQTIIDGLMRPLTAEGCVNVTEDVAFEEYISNAINQAMAEAQNREVKEKSTEVNPDGFAPGTAPGLSAPEEPPKNPDPEALDAPPID